MLLTDCLMQVDDLATLDFLKTGNISGAARAYANYVLDVRDSFDICNAKLANIRNFYSNLKSKGEIKP